MNWWPWNHSRLRSPSKRSHHVGDPPDVAFWRTASMRPLTILIDSDTVIENGGTEEIEFFTELCYSKELDVLRFSELGPPERAEHVSLSNLDLPAYKGWLVWIPRSEGELEPIYYPSPGFEAVHCQAIYKRHYDYALTQDWTKPVEGQTAAPRDQLIAEARLLLIAEESKRDLLITNRPRLLSSSRSVSRFTSCLSPIDAIPLIGLYLRQSDVFPTSQGPKFRTSVDRQLFFWVATRSLLPDGWRWFSACVDHDMEREPELTHIAQSAFHRLSRALQARDRMMAALALPQNNATADEVLDNLDQMTIWLMGAIDVCAQVAHCSLGMTTELKDASWQRDDWLLKVRAKDASLADLFIREEANDRFLRVLRELRNTVHGEALRAIQVSERRQHSETMLGLPRRRQKQLIDDMNHLGGSTEWGVDRLTSDVLYVHPGVLGEKILASSVKLLNELMCSTPVEQLDGVRQESLTRSAPTEWSDPFHPRWLRRAILQLGLTQSP